MSKQEAITSKCTNSTENNLWYRYGITLAERTKMLEDQDGECKVCSSPISFSVPGEKIKRGSGKHVAVVDHCHALGHVRGILCGDCNVLLGKAHDSRRVLRAAADYLEENK